MAVWVAEPQAPSTNNNGSPISALRFNDTPPLRVVKVSTAVFDLGSIEEHRNEGQAVRVFGAARTIADCFRFRNKAVSTCPPKR